MTRTARKSCLFVLAFSAALLLLSCNGAEPIAIQAKDGESCQDCASLDACSDSLANADCPECEECPRLAFDEKSGALLQCDGSWMLKQKCPGGGSVSCRGGSYTVRCFDAEHHEIPFH
jgi:flavoprotein